MRFMITQGHGHRIVWFQGDGGVVSGADRADAVGGASGGAGGDRGGGVRVAHGDGQHGVAALGVRRTQRHRRRNDRVPNTGNPAQQKAGGRVVTEKALF